MTGPHRRLQTINIAGSGAPKMAGARVWVERDRGNAVAIGPRGPDDGPENHPPPLDVARQSVDVAGGMGA